MKKSLFVLLGTLSFSTFASVMDDLKYSPHDAVQFEKTHICNGCDLSGFQASKPLAPMSSFENSNLVGSNLSHSILGGYESRTLWMNSNFENTNLTLAAFRKVMLDGSSFNNSDMQGTYFLLSFASHVSFKNTNLKNAALVSSVFHYSDFTDAKLDGAVLYRSDFCMAKITEEQIKSASNYACVMKPDCSGRYPDIDGKPCG